MNYYNPSNGQLTYVHEDSARGLWITMTAGSHAARPIITDVNPIQPGWIKVDESEFNRQQLLQVEKLVPTKSSRYDILEDAPDWENTTYAGGQ